MSRLRLASGVLTLVLAFSLIISVPALAVGSITLIENSDFYDGHTITYRGEVIGDVMVRGDGVWVNVNDDAYSRQGRGFRLAGYNQGQSVLLPPGSEKKIKQAGNYVWRGDIIEVTGVFHKASADDGGEMMIEARSVKLIKRAFRLDHFVVVHKIVIAVILLLIAEAVLLLSRRFGARTAPRFIG
jgi:hypothetical protein